MDLETIGMGNIHEIPGSARIDQCSELVFLISPNECYGKEQPRAGR